VGLLLHYHSPLYSAAVFAFDECMSAVGWLICSFMMDMLAITNRARLIFVSSNVLEGGKTSFVLDIEGQSFTDHLFESIFVA
jgi:hypothetical protein